MSREHFPWFGWRNVLWQPLCDSGNLSEAGAAKLHGCVMGSRMAIYAKPADMVEAG